MIGSRPENVGASFTGETFTANVLELLKTPSLAVMVMFEFPLAFGAGFNITTQAGAFPDTTMFATGKRTVLLETSDKEVLHARVLS